MHEDRVQAVVGPGENAIPEHVAVEREPPLCVDPAVVAAEKGPLPGARAGAFVRVNVRLCVCVRECNRPPMRQG